MPIASKEEFQVPDLLAKFSTQTTKSPVLIEVKSKKDKLLSLKPEYMRRLKNYADLIGMPLLVAWKFHSLWMLFEVGHMKMADKNFNVTLETAMRENLPVQVGRPPQGASDFKNFTDKEIDSLRRCLSLLKQGGNNDPKLEALIGYLLGTHPGVSAPWLERGCILFSQYYDTVRWVGDEMAKRPEFAGMDIGLYAGSNRSGFWRDGRFQRCDRNVLKGRVRAGELKLMLGTDAASEGLNLQRLGTLINIDLPWNPTRLEQRKGRIQRIGHPAPPDGDSAQHTETGRQPRPRKPFAHHF